MNNEIITDSEFMNNESSSINKSVKSDNGKKICVDNKTDKKWGWNSFYENEAEKYKGSELCAGRIIKESRHLFQIAADDRIYNAEISGSFRYRAVHASDYPVIGDWVMFRKGDEEFCLIEEVLKRKSCFSRQAAGTKTEEQLIAANIDVIGLVFGIHGGRNFTAGGAGKISYSCMGQRSKTCCNFKQG